MKNIMLLFLSPVSRKFENDEPRIEESKFHSTFSEGEEITTIQTNESAVRLLAQELPSGKLDKIFAFASDRVRTKGPLKAEAKTHEAYFRERIASCLREETDLVLIPYDENRAIADSLDSMMAMAEEIVRYTAECGDEVTLHADMTGGMRNASMMMLAVMRYLEYSNIKLGRVLYSDREMHKVEDAQAIYRFFDLVAGAKEFVRFGSVEEIKQYFAKESTSPSLAALLAAMDKFAEELKLCHYGEFVKAIYELKQAVAAFKQEQGKQDLSDRVFASMLHTIDEAYAELFAPEADDLTYIEWCAQRGHLQQAMTLYTERVPEYVFAQGILRQEREDARYKKFVEKDKSLVSYPYWLMTQMDGAVGSDQSDKIQRSISQGIKECLKNVCKKELSQNAVAEQVEALRQSVPYPLVIKWEQEKVVQAIWRLGRLSQFTSSEIAQMRQEDELVEKVIQCYAKEYKKESTPEIIAEKDARAITKYAYTLLKERGNKPDSVATVLDFSLVDGRPYHILKTEQLYAGLKNSVEQGIVALGRRGDETWEALHTIYFEYTTLREIRNFTNHAHAEESVYSAGEIEHLLKSGIEHLRQEEKRVREGKVTGVTEGVAADATK